MWQIYTYFCDTATFVTPEDKDEKVLCEILLTSFVINFLVPVAEALLPLSTFVFKELAAYSPSLLYFLLLPSLLFPILLIAYFSCYDPVPLYFRCPTGWCHFLQLLKASFIHPGLFLNKWHTEH